MLTTTGQDTFAELVETLPVFLREAARQPAATPTSIEFRRGGEWQQAGVDWTDKATAVRLTRFGGAVIIEFDRERRVKLSPAEWNDTYLSKAACRNVLVDLLERNDQPGVVTHASVRYRIQAAAR